MPFPGTRMRRLRQSPPIRAWLEENPLSPGSLILPLFIRPGRGVRRPIPSMPGQSQRSIDRAVLDLHGWEETGEALSRLASRKRWDEMPALIDDRILDAVAVTATESELAAAIRRRYDGLADRLSLYLPFIPGERDDFWRSLSAAFA